MTDHDLEQRLRAWYRADIEDERAPHQLRSDLATLTQTAARSWRPATAGWRLPAMNRFAPFALAATALVVAILIGIGILVRSPNVGPSPAPGPAHSAAPEPSATPEPTQRTAAWSATASMIEPGTGFSATRLADGRVLVAGGAFDNTHHGQAAAELYDPATGTWTPTGSMLAGRYRHSATLLNDGRVLVAGGNANDSGTPGVQCCLASAELYDPSTGTWAATGSMIDPRVEFIATLLNDGRVLVAGGDSANGFSAGAELYDPHTATWAATGAMQLGNYQNQAALLANGKVLVVGGKDANAPPQLYDPSSGSWSMLECPDGNPGDRGCSNTWRIATPLPDGTVLVAGAFGAALYDPRAGTWSRTGRPAIESRDSAFPDSAMLLPNGTVLVLSYPGPEQLAAQLYDLSRGTWTAAAGPSAMRFAAVPTLLLDGRVLLLGGYEDRGYSGGWPVATAELYDPGSGS